MMSEELRVRNEEFRDAFSTIARDQALGIGHWALVIFFYNLFFLVTSYLLLVTQNKIFHLPSSILNPCDEGAGE
ncbi:hypothetical protein [Nitratifractor salsuginis]|uniref:Uncharacterized protein n=1 Tax=Nitratifractor salsuginis (strain DSM 16511 / JCM 12458 / E9I37-1) TaxID=749222 RepID=E6X0R8_NITSE|nr:hypothetical protein [Nitratifractor salsuginis]ADV45788.1 hypothetical protein Nitsa_0518 [Nitratifractor salsuginis DSM 16511]